MLWRELIVISKFEHKVVRTDNKGPENKVNAFFWIFLFRLSFLPVRSCVDQLEAVQADRSAPDAITVSMPSLSIYLFLSLFLSLSFSLSFSLSLTTGHKYRGILLDSSYQTLTRDVKTANQTRTRFTEDITRHKWQVRERKYRTFVWFISGCGIHQTWGKNF